MQEHKITFQILKGRWVRVTIEDSEVGEVSGMITLDKIIRMFSHIIWSDLLLPDKDKGEL